MQKQGLIADRIIINETYLREGEKHEVCSGLIVECFRFVF